MFKTAWRMLWKEKTRFFITTAGIAFSVLLILFLFGIYDGVKKGATSYVQNNEADIWICQKNSTNLLRSSSFLSAAFNKEIKDIDGVQQVSVILRVLTTAEINGKKVTMFIFGYNPESKLGRPPYLEAGNDDMHSGQIIIDKAFAAKHHFSVGDSLSILERSFQIAAISRETNAVVTQFAFTTLDDAQKLLGFPNVCSFYIVKTDSDKNSQAIIDKLSGYYPNYAIFNRQDFTNNNLTELKSGILPILWTIAILGSFTGIAVITLMLYGSVLEKKEDYALLKAIGSSQGYISSLVLKKSLIGAIFGFTLGVSVNALMIPVISKLVPEISVVLTKTALLAVFIISVFICCCGSLLPIQKLSKIYPGEVFRA